MTNLLELTKEQLIDQVVSQESELQELKEEMNELKWHEALQKEVLKENDIKIDYDDPRFHNIGYEEIK